MANRPNCLPSISASRLREAHVLHARHLQNLLLQTTERVSVTSDRGTRELRPLNFLRDERYGEALMMSTSESLRLRLDAMPESVGVARAAVSELAHDLGMGEPRLGDVKTVVSEACTNVVRHAYPDGPGRFEVEASRAGNSLSIVIRDFGVGIQPRFRATGSSLGLGLGLISTLTSRFEIAGGGGGTEIRAELPLPVH